MLSTTSSVAFKFKNGIIHIADTGVSYGSLALTTLNRIFVINGTLVTFNGYVGDFLEVKRILEEEIESDKREIDCSGIHKLLQLYIYGKRTRVEPKFCSIIVSGIQKNGEKFLGVIKSKGTFWYDDFAATGFASYFLLPLLRSKNLLEMTKEEAVVYAHELCRVLIYKDAKATNKIQIGVVSDDGRIEVRNEVVETNWDVGYKLNEIKL
ncbi:hypothetical protein NUSPORA_02486 [Nucleospora cyclopteri]